MSLKAKMRWRRDFLTKEMTKSTIENSKSPREVRPRRPTTKLKKAAAMGAGFGKVKYAKNVSRIQPFECRQDSARKSGEAFRNRTQKILEINHLIIWPNRKQIKSNFKTRCQSGF